MNCVIDLPLIMHSHAIPKKIRKFLKITLSNKYLTNVCDRITIRFFVILYKKLNRLFGQI